MNFSPFLFVKLAGFCIIGAFLYHVAALWGAFCGLGIFLAFWPL